MTGHWSIFLFRLFMFILGSAGNGYQHMSMGDHHMGGGSGGGDAPYYPCSIELPPRMKLANAPPLDPSKLGWRDRWSLLVRLVLLFLFYLVPTIAELLPRFLASASSFLALSL